jgi:hypothetical protein
MKFLIVQLPPFSFTSSLVGPNILLRTLFSNTLSLYSSLSVRDQVSHPYKTTGRIMVVYITFTFRSFHELRLKNALNGKINIMYCACKLAASPY